QIGIAHAEIDNVDPVRPCLGLDRVDVLEDVRRQAANTVKIFAHGFLGGPVETRCSRLVQRTGRRWEQPRLSRNYGVNLVKRRFGARSFAALPGRCRTATREELDSG